MVACVYTYNVLGRSFTALVVRFFLTFASGFPIFSFFSLFIYLSGTQQSNMTNSAK